MISNASDENRQDRTDTPEVRPDGRPICPAWCVDHFEIDAGTGVIHRGEDRETAGYSVQLSRCDFAPWGIVGAVFVSIDGGEPMTPAEATAFAGLVATTAADGMCGEQTVVRTLDLPEGQDYVIFEDCGVVAVSSRLDQDGRRQALADAGVF